MSLSKGIKYFVKTQSKNSFTIFEIENIKDSVATVYALKIAKILNANRTLSNAGIGVACVSCLQVFGDTSVLWHGFTPSFFN